MLAQEPPRRDIAGQGMLLSTLVDRWWARCENEACDWRCDEAERPEACPQCGSRVRRGMTIDERKRMVGLVFDEITADDEGIVALRPRADWADYVRALPERIPLSQERVLSERETGLEPATSTLEESRST